MSVYKSILKNYIAHGMSLGVTFLNQIAIVPLFIALWGVDKYADWILITAFSSFFIMADLGLNTVTTNEFVIKYQRKEYSVCSKLLANAFLFVSVVGGAIVLLSVIFAAIFGFKDLLQASVFSETETSAIFIFLILYVFIKMYGDVYNGIFRATSHTHLYITVYNIQRFIEISILCLGILFHVNIVLIVILYILPGLTTVMYKHFYSQRWFKVKYSVELIDISMLKSFVKPSIAFMFTPLGYAVSNQGMIFVVNALLGPVMLVTFTTTRTLVNFVRYVTVLLSSSIWPEISVAFGKNDQKIISAIFYRSMIVSFCIILICILFLTVFGQSIYTTWTKGVVVFDSLFFYGMLAVLLITCLWHISMTILTATNNHIAFSINFLSVQLIGIFLSYLVLIFYPHLFIIPIVLLPMEFLLLYSALKKINRLFDCNFQTMRTSICKETYLITNRTINTCLNYFNPKQSE
jgi:O-antigen/teichoic acid export membrane protein